MRRVGLLIVLALLTAACEQGGSVGVVNIESVARALGRDTTMQQQAQARQQELLGQLQQVGRQLDERLKAELAKTANDQQKAQLMQVAQQQARQAQNQLDQTFKDYVRKLETDFRNEVNAAAAKVAREKKLEMVILENTVLYANASQNITDDVTKAMRGGAAAPETSSPAKPAG